MKKVFVLVAVLAVSPALADPVIWDNGMVYETGYSSQLDTVYPFDSQLADDFILQPNANIVTDVHWLGVYWNQDPLVPNVTEFNVFFYADDGTGNAPTQPGTQLASYTFPFASVNETSQGAYFSYDVVLPTPLALTPGVKHWIAIQSVNTFPPQWGWGAHASIQLHEAVQGFPLLGLPYWSDPDAVPGTTDAAFQLTGIPEPATLALLGLGLLGLIRRR